MAFREEPSLALLGSFIAAAAVLGERRALACGCVRVERPVRSGTDDGRNTAFLCSILATVEREGKCERPFTFFPLLGLGFEKEGKRERERGLCSLFLFSRGNALALAREGSALICACHPSLAIAEEDEEGAEEREENRTCRATTTSPIEWEKKTGGATASSPFFFPRLGWRVLPCKSP